jgi:single-strand DNA-binding protein
MNDLLVTITGWAATDPKVHVVPGGTDLVSFRLASTSRYFDKGSGDWVNRETEWFTVRVFRAPAMLVQRSVKKGQPVVVVGRLHSNNWTGKDGDRTELVIDAQTVGHDLTLGVADFARAVVEKRADASDEEPPPEEPADLDAVEDDESEERELVDAPF